MNKVQQILDGIYQDCPGARERRRDLLEQMQKLDSEAINCKNCPGYCCTFEYNSMKVDPLQALELYQYLVNENMLTDSLLEILDQTIAQYRLDYEPYIGANKTFRRYYTCPLYRAGEPLACPISFESKPYGCLAYNASERGVELPDKCSSELSALELRETKFDKYESQANAKLKEYFNLNWQKEYLPIALKQIHKFFKEN